MTLSRRQHQWLDLAAKIAMDSTCRMKHGAVIVRGSSVLAVGTNKFRNHPATIKDYQHCSVHAEVVALRRVGSQASHTDLYVARVSRHGEHRLSRPCGTCWGALVRSGVHRVVYTIGPGTQGIEKILGLPVDNAYVGA
jgi:tRNA(Arg) A34 adenosine deaminase TadA